MELNDRLKAVRLVALDLDGVLTDGRVWLTTSGEEMLGFDVKDGMGINRLIKAGIKVAVISSRTSGVIIHRAKDLGINWVRVRESNKLKALKEIIGEVGCELGAVAFVGDDLADLEVMKAVGCAVAVGDAVDRIVSIAHLHLSKPGGRGAVRELAEKILRAQGKEF